MTFGNRLKDLRKSKGMTQMELGEKINLSQANISKYESDSLEPNIETLSLLSSLLDVSADYLLGLTDDRKAVLPRIHDDEVVLLVNEMDTLILKAESLLCNSELHGLGNDTKSGLNSLLNSCVYKKLKEAREKNGLTQEGLGIRIGKSKQWISELERGNIRLSYEYAMVISAVYGKTPDYFLPTKSTNNRLSGRGEKHETGDD